MCCVKAFIVFPVAAFYLSIMTGSKRTDDLMPYSMRFQLLLEESKENQGKGEAIKTALQYIRAELWEYSAVGIMDADGQHLPEDMEKLLMRAGRNPGTLVLGTRNLDQSTPWKSRFGNQITRKIFKPCFSLLKPLT